MLITNQSTLLSIQSFNSNCLLFEFSYLKIRITLCFSFPTFSFPSVLNLQKCTFLINILPCEIKLLFSPLLQQQTRIKTPRMYATFKVMWSNEEIKKEQKFKFKVLAEKAELPYMMGKHYWSRNKSRRINSRQRWQKQELFNSHQHKMIEVTKHYFEKEMSYFLHMHLNARFWCKHLFLMLGQWHISNIQSRHVKLENRDLSSYMLELLCLLEGVALTIQGTMLLTRTAVGIWWATLAAQLWLQELLPKSRKDHGVANAETVTVCTVRQAKSASHGILANTSGIQVKWNVILPIVLVVPLTGKADVSG